MNSKVAIFSDRILFLLLDLNSYSNNFYYIFCFSPSELPSTRGEDVQAKCLLELYGLKVNLMFQRGAAILVFWIFSYI